MWICDCFARYDARHNLVEYLSHALAGLISCMTYEKFVRFRSFESIKTISVSVECNRERRGAYMISNDSCRVLLRWHLQQRSVVFRPANYCVRAVVWLAHLCCGRNFLHCVPVIADAKSVRRKEAVHRVGRGEVAVSTVSWWFR